MRGQNGSRRAFWALWRATLLTLPRLFGQFLYGVLRSWGGAVTHLTVRGMRVSATFLARYGRERAERCKGMSNQEAMQQLADRFVNDANFRDQMRQDPEGAAERSGLPL